MYKITVEERGFEHEYNENGQRIFTKEHKEKLSKATEKFHKENPRIQKRNLNGKFSK